jgi:hypothetical protein
MTVLLQLTAANNATWSYGPILLKDDAGAPLAMPEGVKIRMQLRDQANSVNVTLELSLDNECLAFVDRPAASLHILVPAMTMKDVVSANYPYDIIVEYPSARVVRPVAGNVVIEQGVTR